MELGAGQRAQNGHSGPYQHADLAAAALALQPVPRTDDAQIAAVRWRLLRRRARFRRARRDLLAGAGGRGRAAGDLSAHGAALREGPEYRRLAGAARRDRPRCRRRFFLDAGPYAEAVWRDFLQRRYRNAGGAVATLAWRCRALSRSWSEVRTAGDRRSGRLRAGRHRSARRLAREISARAGRPLPTPATKRAVCRRRRPPRPSRRSGFSPASTTAAGTN